MIRATSALHIASSLGLTQVESGSGMGDDKTRSSRNPEIESSMTTLPFPAPLGPPPNRGRLLTPAQVAELIGGLSPAWVRRNVPYKVCLGHSTVRWYENDVRAWLESRREATSAALGDRLA
jgi:predicted DNA-binding transcriptional regulator AlpA